MPAAKNALMVTAGLSGHFDHAIAARLEAAASVAGCVLVTDADGTIWKDDIGESFLRRLIADGVLVSPQAQGIDVWKSYEARVAVDKGAGYAWAVQVMAGLPEAEIRARAAAYAKEFVPARVYPQMRALLDEVRDRGCTPWIVSASGQLIIEAAAPLLGLPAAQAIGIRTVIREGRLTDELEAPITYRQGKVEAIRRFIGLVPTIVAGDSAGDLEMLGAATGAALFIDHEGKTEPAFVEQIRSRGWLVQAFPQG